MTLTPDGLLGATFKFFFRVVNYNNSTNDFTGNLTMENGTVPEGSTLIPLRNGKFRPPTAATQPYRMNFEVNLGGLDIFLGGTATPLPDDPDKLGFSGTYFRFRNSSELVSVEPRGEPGDTGTGGGNQTGA